METATRSDGGLSFERIYDERFNDVTRWVRAFGGRAGDIPDLVQDVFLVAYRRLPHFEDGNVPGWLYQIARRKVRDYRNKSWVKSEVALGAIDECFRTADPDQLERIALQERAKVLDHLLNLLPDEQRAAIVLFEVEGLTGAQIAELQQVPINTVWARMHKARRRMRARLVALSRVSDRAR